jgi:hypothetical protein
MNGAKKYIVISKVGNNKDGTASCVRYHVSDLMKYAEFLDQRFPDWTWSNIYDKVSKNQLGSFTKKSRPISKWL